jgi:corrinoid protein of di/trimethylamine methyltransferase
VEADKERVLAAAKEALGQNIDPMDILTKGFTKGMQIVGDKFEQMDIFLPEMLLSAEATKAGIDLVKPHIKAEAAQQEGVVVIGTIQSDVHDIGKNIVAFYLEVSGFKVYNLGKDVPPRTFVDQAEAQGADIIGISALLTSTMAYIPDVIEELKQRGLREKYTVMVGGGAVTPEWAAKIGADGCGADFASRYLEDIVPEFVGLPACHLLPGVSLQLAD